MYILVKQVLTQNGALYIFCGVVNTFSELGLVWMYDSASDCTSQIAKGGALLSSLWHSIAIAQKRYTIGKWKANYHRSRSICVFWRIAWNKINC